jgi:gamma-glutamyl-gamma-aminobutyrate hydrolase PuuD
VDSQQETQTGTNGPTDIPADGPTIPAKRLPRRKRRFVLWIAVLVVSLLVAIVLLPNLWRVAVPADAPVIGVSFDQAWHAHCGLSTKNYELCLLRAGARIRILDPGEDDPHKVLDEIDGLLLTGGGDVDPELYAGQPGTGQLVDRERDDFEIALIHGAVSRDMPMLGICRGVQILNVAHGGTIRNLRDDPARSARHGIGLSSFNAHNVTVESNSRLAELAGAGTMNVNSFHGQAVGDLGDGLSVAAVAEDGVIEAVERPDKTFIVATQWHPEIPPPDLRYFERLLAEAEQFRRRTRQQPNEN